MTLDLHVHTFYSPDSWLKPEHIIRTAKKRGLDGVAVTDHNTICGGVDTRAANTDSGFLVIVGSEVCTDVGDITGLFLEREITAQKWDEVIDEIHEQGGLAILPHPFKGHHLSDELISRVDVIELFNARTSLERNAQARDLARQWGKPGIAGSDAHLAREIGACRVHTTGEDVRTALITGAFTTEVGLTAPYLQCQSQIIRSLKERNYAALPIQIAVMLKKLIAGA